VRVAQESLHRRARLGSKRRTGVIIKVDCHRRFGAQANLVT
jgi:hypothetical protein